MNKDFKKFAETATEKDMDELCEKIQNDYPDPKEIDFTKQGWGHSFNPDTEYGVWVKHGSGFYSGFGNSIRLGSVVLLNLVSGNIGRLLVVDIEKMQDPRDMFFASVVLLGYKDK